MMNNFVFEVRKQCFRTSFEEPAFKILSEILLSKNLDEILAKIEEEGFKFGIFKTFSENLEKFCVEILEVENI